MPSRGPILLADALKHQFDPARMGTGMKRGLVLRVAPARIKQALGRAGFARDLQRLHLTGPDNNPVLVITMRSGSLWQVEIHHHRQAIRDKINERVKGEFLQDVRVR